MQNQYCRKSLSPSCMRFLKCFIASRLILLPVIALQTSNMHLQDVSCKEGCGVLTNV